MKRVKALALVEGILERLVAGHGSWPLSLIREAYVFGSAARGALQPGDVDVDVEFDHSDERWVSEVITGLTYGYDPHRVFRQALAGRKRGIQFAFDYCGDADFPMTLLWRRGEDLQTAMARLHAIELDPEAGRAQRHAMLPEFEGLDRWLPREYRENMIDAIDKGAIQMERLTLKDLEVSHPLALEHLMNRWQPTSPLYRAGRAVFAHLIERGIDPAQVHLHDRVVHDPDPLYFAGFSLRYLRAIQRCFTEFGGKEWIEVVHPTRHGELIALRFFPLDLARLREVTWLRD